MGGGEREREKSVRERGRESVCVRESKGKRGDSVRETVKQKCNVK